MVVGYRERVRRDDATGPIDFETFNIINALLVIIDLLFNWIITLTN